MRVVLNGPHAPLEVDPRDPDRLEVAVGPGPVTPELIQAAEALIPSEAKRHRFRQMVAVKAGLPVVPGVEEAKAFFQERGVLFLTRENLGGMARDYLVWKGVPESEGVVEVFLRGLRSHPDWASRLAGEQEIRRRLCKAFHRRGLSPEASARLASALLYLAASAEG